MKKLLGLLALAAVGYGIYLEYQRRKAIGDEFVLKLDQQLTNIVDDVAAKIDATMEKVEKKLDETQTNLERSLKN